ncbi:MAG TPA: PBP1A family penicillin-binding protein [Candidatus Acidoferrum sp.]|nr:PBP1A family penicillin-binding protein [Candidatus Acidoferrum sp.]
MCVALAALLAGASILTYYYIQFGRMVRERLTGQIFQNTSGVYSAPRRIYPGEKMTEQQLGQYLLDAGYQTAAVDGSPGEVDESDDSLVIKPSDDSYFHGSNAIRVDFSGPYISRISALPNGQGRDFADIEPELITNLFDNTREKRRIVPFDELPKNLVSAVLAAEDKRFYEHGAFDLVRIFGAAFYDLSAGRKAQGASTIDMQVARTFFFSTRRVWSRKLKEALMAFEIDQRFSKQQIFELYADDVYLGNRGTFAIRGFGEAANAYFGKDVRSLDLGECAFLAGIIRAPNRYSAAEHHMPRAIDARNRVLKEMAEDGYVSKSQVDDAENTQLKFVTSGIASGMAPYFVDMVKDHLLSRLSESDLENESFRIYTTLDPQLQEAATQAVSIGMESADKLLARRYAIWKKRGENVPPVQCALVAMNPYTGEILALVGGRDYGESQLNHALAHRQPGSSFKPFVYAAAFNNDITNTQPMVTPATTVDDVPTTFDFDGKEYTPNNFDEEFFGTVTVHDALMHSLNVATIKVAQLVGYQRVVDFVRQMGITDPILATPAMALGTYEMTPIEVAAGYTAFATDGTRAEPLFIRSVVTSDGRVEEQNAPQTRPVLDPRVAFLTTSLMEDVINHGTGYTVRQMGFDAPAAGKTGTSHDGWFAGYTSKLLCVVWVGFDDNRDLNLAGAESAAPVWAEFMKRAIQLPDYRNPQPFQPPPGMVEDLVDADTGQLATPLCPKTANEYFIAGSQPTEYCQEHGGIQAAQSGGGSWLSRLFGKGGNAQPQPPSNGQPASNATPQPGKPLPGQTVVTVDGQQRIVQQPPQPEPEKKKGLFDKIFGIFGGSKKPPDKPKDQP